MKIITIVIINCILILLFIVLNSILLVNNKREIDTWNLSVKNNTNSSYNLYILKYSKGVFSESANNKLDELTWKESLKTNSSESYEKYRKLFPKGEFVVKADSFAVEILWKETLKSNTLESYKSFKDKYPSSIYTELAKDKCSRLDFTLDDVSNVSTENFNQEWGFEGADCGTSYYTKKENKKIMANGGYDYISINKHVEQLKYDSKMSKKGRDVLSNDNVTVIMEVKQISSEGNNSKSNGTITIIRKNGQKKIIEVNGVTNCF